MTLRRQAATAAALLFGAFPATIPAARADLKLCNSTASRVGVAIGYQDNTGWATEGWWNIASQTCETLLKGPVPSRFVYVHAVDYDRGGEWGGKNDMCTADKSFAIKGVQECSKRGYKRSGFFEVDTGEAKEWTIRLTDPEHRAPRTVARSRAETKDRRKMRRNRRVKIVATLGPASAAPEMVERLFLAGVDVFRINMSHSTAGWRQDALQHGARLRRPPPPPDRHPRRPARPEIPHRRVPRRPRATPEKSNFVFDRDEVLGTNDARVPAARADLRGYRARPQARPRRRQDPHAGSRGTKDKITTEVTVGGMLASPQGHLNARHAAGRSRPLTEKDKADLANALKLGMDWVALSFVQRAEDVHEVRKLIGTRAAILSKIEKPSAVADLEKIIAASDGIMVARGDLGVEMPVEKVPGLQKKITRLARAAGKPVIVATQMLESMISSPMPTRAEVSDVATAVFDGADAIMLSAESAVGQYPVEAIRRWIASPSRWSTIPSTSRSCTRRRPTAADRRRRHRAAASAIADTVKLGAIVCYTATGSTVLRVTASARTFPSSA